MARTLAQIEAQIAKLQQAAEALRAREIQAVVAQVKGLIAEHGLTAADLGLDGAAADRPRVRKARVAASGRGRRSGAAKMGRGAAPVSAGRPAKAAKSGKSAAAAKKTKGRARKTGVKKSPTAAVKGVIRFRDEAGNAWTGRGKRPAWFLAALAAGKSADDLRVSDAG